MRDVHRAMLQGSDESSSANEEQFAALLVGPKMSGKSFRVSDGDWICPDKKYVHDQNTLLLRLQSKNRSMRLHLAMVGLLWRVTVGNNINKPFLSYSY